MMTPMLMSYLEENIDKVRPEVQDDYKGILLRLGLTMEKNSSFIEFMSAYSDEFYGKYGLIHDVMNDDLSDIEEGVSNYLWSNEGVPKNYISLSNLEVEDYLLYDKDNDHVVLIEGASADKVLNHEFDAEWSSFNEFLEDFFELNQE